ncbi:response regulator [Spirulina sp. CS-785/01]|uniref:response regulator n=1 Tax=Spirulina sp. CS-785/01 TaxID=3021716 RepID=UPI002330065A|nr:response regulator [Spirulina sp. CS-785/01]MDB9313619.1 response regulator [Spirulina sp. CS-785/01]
MTKRILIIDDDEGIREIAQICLETVAGWDVLMAASGKEGIMMAQVEQPDSILLDLTMPEMNGIETFQQLQGNSQSKEIPTILLTAQGNKGDNQQFLELGFTGVINKPFEAMELVTQMCQILGWEF